MLGLARKWLETGEGRLLSSCRNGRTNLPVEASMELRHLRYFAAVAQDLSFRRAARRLNLSHPSLSQQITKLENERSLKLFKRNSRRLTLPKTHPLFLTLDSLHSIST